MSSTVGVTQEEAADLIASVVNGDNPFQEAEELRAFAESPEHFYSLMERRLMHEPVGYITKKATFYGLDLFIDQRVLIPRSETEALVQAAIDEIPQRSKVADVGTGSGAVALALKKHRPDLEVWGFDISKDALDVASINSATLDIDVEWDDADLLLGVKQEFDAVLANLPYLPTKDEDKYAPEMTEHEPTIALWGGNDGYDLMRRLLMQISGREKVKMVGLEIGKGQENDVISLVRNAGFPIIFGTTDKRHELRAVIGKR